MNMKRSDKQSALVVVLKALVPYTRENLLLGFMPKQFFYELERSSGYSEKVLRNTYYRARKTGFVTTDAIPRLTTLGQRKVLPYTAKHLDKSASLLVIFDIPEVHASRRRQFRRLLQSLGFKQVQLSVWTSSYDHRETLRQAVQELGIQNHVQLFESVEVPLK